MGIQKHSKLGLFMLLVMVWTAISLVAVPPGAAKVENKATNGDEYGISHTKNLTADHSKFEILMQEFESGPEVTKACLSCHTEAAKQIQKTIHWQWISPTDPDQKLGKMGLVVNNFCVAVPSNEPRCTSCHIGYGWKDKTFDLTQQERIDCLVCHEQTGTYVKFPVGAGNPVPKAKKFPGNGKM